LSVRSTAYSAVVWGAGWGNDPAGGVQADKGASFVEAGG
jgi:hypothetical protein